MAADRFSINKSWEHIQNRYVGTGHSDISRYEMATMQHRDTIASHIGHYDMLSYFAVAQNDSIGRVRYQLLQVPFILLVYDLLVSHFICFYLLLCTLENAAAMRFTSAED